MANTRKGTHAQKIRKQKEPFSFAALPLKTKKWIIAAAALVVCLIVAFCVLNHFDLFHGVTGRLRYYNGTLYDVAENDVIVNNGTKSDPKYYKIATYTPTDKYTFDAEYSVKTDDNLPEWTYRPGQDGISFLYITGVAGSMEDALGDLIANTTEANTTEDTTEDTTEEADTYEIIEGVNADGLKYQGVFTAAGYDEENEEYYKYMNAYVDCGKKGCVLVMAYAKATTEDGFASKEVFQNYLQEMADAVKLPEE